ncbi:MAG: flagellar protein FlaG, partial [Syntrophomonas sp.]|nr:flagellar protein FlaG [Syntrophomonas sp.]
TAIQPGPKAKEKTAKNMPSQPVITLANLNVSPDNKPYDVKMRQDKELSREKLYNIVQNTNKLITMSHYHLQFRIDDESERLQVKLIDDESNEVIREIPPDNMLALSAKIKEIIDTFRKMVGVFVDVLA